MYINGAAMSFTPFVCTPSAEKVHRVSLAAPVVDGPGVCAQILPLAVKQFRKDWPFMAARLDSLRAKA
jgi:hypothetical protein